MSDEPGVTSKEEAHRAAMHDVEIQYLDGGKGRASVPVISRPASAPDFPPQGDATAVGPILPPGVAPLQTASLQRHVNDAVAQVCDGIVHGTLRDDEVEAILKVIPRDRMRRLVYEYAGMGSSLLMTLNKQVALVDAVLSQLVSPDGHLKPQLSESGPPISLKDAMNLSVKCSQLILRDLPKVYNVERVQRLEMAIGDIMEKHLTPEQQSEVLKRLEELTTDKAK